MRRIIVCIAFAMALGPLLVSSATPQDQPPNTNILTRVICIQYGTSRGSAFSVEVDHLQYLITAAHVVKGIHDTDHIQVLTRNRWRSIRVHVIRPLGSKIDVVALAPEIQLTNTYEIDYRRSGIVLSQSVFFLGYPFNLANVDSSGWRFPVVKHGYLSSVVAQKKDSVIYYVDAMVNRGFSGGPLVFQKRNRVWQIIGVVTSTVASHDTVYTWDTTKSPPQKRATNEFVESNVGLLTAYSIDPIIDAIKQKPIGAVVH